MSKLSIRSKTMRFISVTVISIILTAFSGGFAPSMTSSSRPSLKISYITTDLAVSDITNPAWKKADKVAVDRYWSGSPAPAGRRFNVRLLWSNRALHALFEAAQEEPLVIVEKPDLTRKAMGLWDRDVVEIFVAPDASEPRKYFEFEAAPTGEWLDVALDLTSGTRVSDWKYASGMKTFSRKEAGKILTVLEIPWPAFGRTPKAGDIWLGNLLRCVGKGPDRGYLAWQPTLTKEPAFHVPEKFGEFRFTD